MERKQKTVLVLGNEFEDIDALPIKILPRLQKQLPTIDFLLFDPTEELPPDIGEEMILIDTVVGLQTITVFHTLEEFSLSPRVTVHDFDLPLFLGMLKKLGKLNDITIIGLPPNFGEEEAIEKIIPFISSNSR